jgi:carbamoyltransferase
MPTLKTPRTLAEQYHDIFSTHARGSQADVLGLSAFGHDSAAALIHGQTGATLFAITEERLSNIKHDWHFPVAAIHDCLTYARQHHRAIRKVAVNFRYEEFVEKTLCQEIERNITHVHQQQKIKLGLRQLVESADYVRLTEHSQSREALCDLFEAAQLNHEQCEKVALRCSWYLNWSIKYRKITEEIGGQFDGIEIEYVNHHTAHAASAFYNSGFDSATVITLDGSGEADTATVFAGTEQGLVRLSQTNWPHSLGIFYLLATQHLGYGLGDEYKVMGMSAYGKPVYRDMIRAMLTVTADGRLQQNAGNHLSLGTLEGTGHVIYKFADSLAQVIPPRASSQPIEQAHFDFAASIQCVTEEIGVAFAQQAMQLTGLKKLAIAGGVGLNGLMNEAIRQRSGCEDIFIYPAASDDGTCVGAAQFALARDVRIQLPRITTCYLGKEFSAESIQDELQRCKIGFATPASIHRKIAEALADGKIVARFHGRSEFGPRALGNRSILANPCLASMKDTLNARVKHREQFRPFAPACLQERTTEYFEMEAHSPFMLLIGKATESAKHKIPAVVHSDGTARVQTVTREQNFDFYEVIRQFEKISGVPVVVNTSFNVNGEAIVETPQDAIESFGFMDIDFLAIGPYWVSKQENIAAFPHYTDEAYLAIRKARYQSRDLGNLAAIDNSQFDRGFMVTAEQLEQFLHYFNQRKHLARRAG